LPGLKKLTRDQLNEKAEKIGIADAAYLPNRRAVIEAIEERQLMFEGVSPDLFKHGARVLKVHQDRTVIEVSTDLAGFLFRGPLAESSETSVATAVEEDLEQIRKRDAKVAASAVAASALQMGRELDDPYNSASAKAQCARALQAHLDRLLELSPPGQEEEGKLHELKSRREARRLSAA
jgi:hypothetical protein